MINNYSTKSLKAAMQNSGSPSKTFFKKVKSLDRAEESFFLKIKRLWKMAMGRLPERARAERGQRML
jgi:hypothetical protein